MDPCNKSERTAIWVCVMTATSSLQPTMMIGISLSTSVTRGNHTWIAECSDVWPAMSKHINTTSHMRMTSFTSSILALLVSRHTQLHSSFASLTRNVVGGSTGTESPGRVRCAADNTKDVFPELSSPIMATLTFTPISCYNEEMVHCSVVE